MILTVTNFIQLVSPQLVDWFSQTKLHWKAPNENYLQICEMYKSDNKQLRYQVISNCKSVVATTRRNGTRDMLTSAKLSVSYLVVGITRELDKEPSLYYPLYIYIASGPCYNNIYPALKSMLLSHVLLLIHMCFP